MHGPRHRAITPPSENIKLRVVCVTVMTSDLYRFRCSEGVAFIFPWVPVMKVPRYFRRAGGQAVTLHCFGFHSIACSGCSSRSGRQYTEDKYFYGLGEIYNAERAAETMYILICLKGDWCERAFSGATRFSWGMKEGRSSK